MPLGNRVRELRKAKGLPQHKLAKVLEADPDELLFLAKRIPDRMKKILERPDAFPKSVRKK